MLVSCCAPFTFPEGCADVVTPGENRALPDVNAVGDGVWRQGGEGHRLIRGLSL